MDAIRRYDQIRKDAQSKGETKQVRHLEGWHDAKKSTIKYLYRKGKVDLALALRVGVTAKDHIEAIQNGMDPVKLAEAGIDLRRVAAVQARMLGQITAKTAQGIAAQIAAQPKMAMMIKKHDGQSRVVMSAVVVKRESPDVVMALANHEARARAKKAAEAKAKHGFEVRMSDAEIASLVRRENLKGKPIIK